MLWWASKGVRAVLGLDGRRVDAKAHAHSTRDTRRKKTEELLKDTTLSPDQRDRLIKQVLRVDTAYILAITNMARSEGIVVYRAPFEFDPQGALLNRLGANYAVVSRDNDLLWYGAGRVIREVNRKDCTVVMYTAERVWQAATTAGQASHAPFNKLVSVLGITGAAVCAAMVASDYNKVSGWSATHALERLAQPTALQALKRAYSGPPLSKDAPWGAPPPAADTVHDFFI